MKRNLRFLAGAFLLTATALFTGCNSDDDFLMNPQNALDAPRWQWIEGKKVQLEDGVPGEIVAELQRRGHEITVMSDYTSFGRGQIIWRDENGVLAGATEPRTDGTVAAW